MRPTSWPCPLPGGGTSEEFALCRDSDRRHRLLIVPALFDEGNKLRRFTVELMHRFDVAGLDSFLPDLPGCNESLQPLDVQTPAIWSEAVAAAGEHFGATHTLGIRGGCLLTPGRLPRLHYAPVKAAAILRQMLRARVLSSREAGTEETRDTLAATALTEGITLSGYSLAADFYRQFEVLIPAATTGVISQDDVGGSGLWLRAEPDESPEQADALAALVLRMLAQ